MNIEETLAGMIDSGRIPHAIMFSEPDGGPAFRIALGFLERLYGTSGGRVAKLIHPDVHFIFPTTSPLTSTSLMPQFRELACSNPAFTEVELNEALGIEGKSSLIAVAEAKEVLASLSLSALEGGWRSVVMYLPEKMNQETANRLLKSIEEPSEKTLFLLITHAPEKVLRTIWSRCQHFQLGDELRAPDFDSPELLDALMDALAAKDLCAALEAGEKISALPSRENAKAFCKFAADAMRNMFIAQQGLDIPSTGTGRAREWAPRFRKTFPRAALTCFDRAWMLVDRNVNTKLVFTDLVNKLSRLC